ncbi:DNA polymerase III subunit gamma/tau [Nitrincola alkalilacustris]|uniref:DNA polymerase III subunit gamma/tau n=1 Tax=Nitrincola alkalilacustris TaxID=1571224 RepID=UPI00124BE26C|nr:DNA polymerase III subunit gamma/tau [Nitrincola alkalilacustris]
MSYQVLARKWRPRRFTEMVGQEHVLKALVNALDDGRLHHAYLFTGTRGVGKTSIARLFAKSLNCEEGISSEPCGKCTACLEIAEGRFVDLIEVDAASRTKVEDTRELLENVQYAPTHGRFKIYLIDEVHMLSGHSFNALLKTLEEPPPHIKFLLATTDPQKLPVTILSRCLQFNLKNMIPQRIVEHLAHVLTEESIPYDEPSLWLLARSAEGSMRDALSLTDQAIAFGGGQVNETDVRAMLGTIDHRLVYRILEGLADHDPHAVIETLAELSRFSPDYQMLLGDIVSLLHRIALAQMLPDAIDNSLGDKEQLLSLASRLRAEEVQLYYQIGLVGRKDMPYVPDAREGLEMVLLRMLAFRPASAQPLAAVSELKQSTVAATASASTTSAAMTGSATTGSTTTSSAAPAGQPVGTSQQSEAVQSAPEPPSVAAEPTQTPVLRDHDQPADTPVSPMAEQSAPPWDDEVPPWLEQEGEANSTKKPEQRSDDPVTRVMPPALEAVQPQAASTIVQKSVAEEPITKVSDQAEPRQQTSTTGATEPEPVAPDEAIPEIEALQVRDWVTLVDRTGLSGMTANIARNLSLEQVNGHELVFHFTIEQDELINDTQRTRIVDALQQTFGCELQVVFKREEQRQETPARYAARRRAERQAEAVALLSQDPIVQTLIEQFDARLVTESVIPIDSE